MSRGSSNVLSSNITDRQRDSVPPQADTDTGDTAAALSEPADTPRSCDDKPVQQAKLPDNVFLVNTDVDVKTALAALKQWASATEADTLVLYGWWHRPELLCFVSGLLHWGVPAANILVVDPDSQEQEGPLLMPVLGDAQVEAAVLDALEACGVSLCQGCELQSWTCGVADWNQDVAGAADAQFATHITLRPKRGAYLQPLLGRVRREESEGALDKTAPISVPCMALFCFPSKTIDPVTFSALAASGLVTDGLLVIDRLGRTNDPFILAGGPVTTYQRKLCAADMDHPYYSGLEIGHKMAQQMRRLWDPVLKARAQLEERTPASSEMSAASGADGSLSTATPADDRVVTRGEVIGEAVRAVLGPYWHYSGMVPTLTAPVVLSCVLPGHDGELHFLHVRAPGPFPLAAEGRTFQSGQPMFGTFSRVVSDATGFVREILCLTTQPLPVDMLVAWYGQREDNLAAAADILAHLSSPDVMRAVFHRDPYRESQRQRDLDALFGYPSCKVVPAVTAALESNDWRPLEHGRRAALRLQWAESPEQRSIEQRVVTLLRDHGFSVLTEDVREAVRALLDTKEGWN
ncbi:hypothetical protein ONE63_001875 [Megalurothrips usitatus]|uniref:CFAP61 dimerisation domain-containing protein n=1 Tax=Megalurothrips usitatus TaxID=439358 RepID=A0AAV7XDH0_9NEOP|nr:hypothetical protein ONE63_001875 [Megalurothrips usitatus]